MKKGLLSMAQGCRQLPEGHAEESDYTACKHFIDDDKKQIEIHSVPVLGTGKELMVYRKYSRRLSSPSVGKAAQIQDYEWVQKYKSRSNPFRAWMYKGQISVIDKGHIIGSVRIR